MFDRIPVKRASVARVVNTTFPQYKGRKIWLEPARTVNLNDLNWSGGTRNQYRTCTLDGRAIGGSERYAMMAPWENPAEGITLPLPTGFLVVRHGMYQGRDVGLTIYVHPDDLAGLLPAAAAA